LNIVRSRGNSLSFISPLTPAPSQEPLKPRVLYITNPPIHTRPSFCTLSRPVRTLAFPRVLLLRCAHRVCLCARRPHPTTHKAGVLVLLPPRKGVTSSYAHACIRFRDPTSMHNHPSPPMCSFTDRLLGPHAIEFQMHHACMSAQARRMLQLPTLQTPVSPRPHCVLAKMRSMMCRGTCGQRGVPSNRRR
jgi:hypothetical protein